MGTVRVKPRYRDSYQIISSRFYLLLYNHDLSLNHLLQPNSSAWLMWTSENTQGLSNANRRRRPLAEFIK